MLTVILVFVLFCALQVALVVSTARYWGPILVLLLVVAFRDLDNAAGGFFLSIPAMPFLWLGIWYGARKRKKQRVRQADKALYTLNRAILDHHRTKHEAEAAKASMELERLKLWKEKNEKPEPEHLMIEESVTAALRRQVPARFDESPRSWIGGLPRMPAHVPWPVAQSRYKDRGQVYLHFLAQICCEDLPEQLWGGLGPRSGWLLLFCNVHGEIAMDESTQNRPVQVIHINELGPERPLPEGIRPIGDKEHAALYEFHYFPSRRQTPASWRRWPVDIVSFPNELAPEPPEPAEDEEPEYIPRLTSEELYQTQSVDDRRFYRPEPEELDDPDLWPFTWRGALAVIEAIERRVSARNGPADDPTDEDILNDQEWFEAVPARLEDRIDNLNAAIERSSAISSERPKEKSERARLARLKSDTASYEETLELVRQVKNTEELKQKFSEIYQNYLLWEESLPQKLAELKLKIQDHPMDEPIGHEDFRPIFDQLNAPCKLLLLSRYGKDRHFLPRLETMNLLRFSDRGFEAARSHIAADLYVASREKRDLIPQTLLEELEPKWRSLTYSAHRMGGYHDPVQSDVGEYPRSYVLLFQIASDNAMEWTWGDAGAIYVYVGTDALKQNDFTQITAYLEC
jgi:uncharacterized protein YwqG